MPELPELEALRIRLAPRLEGRLITAATVNPKKAHMLRYPVEHFANELPARRIVSLSRRGKHLVFATELGGGGSERWLVINPMLGGRFQMADGEVPVPATEVFTIRIEGRQELRYLDFRDMGRIYWATDLAREIPGWAELGPEADSVSAMGIDVFRKRLRRFRDELKDLLRNQEFLAGIGNAYSDESGGGGTVCGDPDGAFAGGRGDSGQPELRGVEAGPVVHVGAYERRQDVPPLRASDQPARIEPGAAQLLPGLPALGAAALDWAHLWRALPIVSGPSPSPTHLSASTLISGGQAGNPGC